MKIRFTNRYESAMTLAELLIAFAILGIMSVAIINSFSYGFHIMQMTRENQRATQIMVEKFEAIRLFSWDQVMVGAVPTNFTDSYDPQEGTNSGVVYFGTITVNPLTGAAHYRTNIRQFDLTLVWTNGFGKLRRTRSLSTYVGKNGIQNYVY
jgi:type II secretory pathway pseudopilin PulG